MDEFIVGIIFVDFSVIVIFSVDVAGFKVDWDISGVTVVLSFEVLLLIIVGVVVIVEIYYLHNMYTI